MAELVLCKICGKRRARRACPAVSGDICAICCGTEREVSLSCPLECEFLVEAHRREKPVTPDDELISYPDVVVTEEFLADNEELLLFSVYTLLQGALRTAGAIDSDVITALESLIQTRRTLESGLLYESRPENTIAAEIQRLFSRSMEDYNKTREQDDPLHPVRNANVLGVLVFLHRIGRGNQNGRPRGRMFIDLLRQMLPAESRVQERASGIII